MIQKDKQLLLVDLCARLPYELKLKIRQWKTPVELTIIKRSVLSDNYIINENYKLDDIKPYLRPLSSMTDEEKKEYHDLCFEEEREVLEYGEWVTKVYYHDTIDSIDWLNKKKFDYRGLIPKGLAISTEKFNPYNEDYDSRQF